MARGGFTEQELAALNKNKYVLYAENNKIAYSNEFKHHFMKELLSGKRPKEIFAEAGFDVEALGSKRIERATSRWKESYKAGTLGNYDDSKVREVHARRKDKHRNDCIDKTVYRQSLEIKNLEEKIASRDRKISELQINLKMLREELINPNVSDTCENIAHLTEINKLNEDLLKQRSTEIRYLQAKVKILATIGFTEKDEYNFTKGDKDKIYEFIYNTFKNYRVKRSADSILRIMGIDPRSYYHYLNLKNLSAENNQEEK